MEDRRIDVLLHEKEHACVHTYAVMNCKRKSRSAGKQRLLFIVRMHDRVFTARSGRCFDVWVFMGAYVSDCLFVDLGSGYSSIRVPLLIGPIPGMQSGWSTMTGESMSTSRR